MTTVSNEDLEGLVTSLSQPSDNSRSARQPEDDVPEKYRGKSAAELIEMHRNAERELGRLGHALGEQRDLVNVLATKIDTKRRKDLGDDTDPEPVKLTPEALLDNPEAVLEKWLRSKQSRKASDNEDENDRVRKLEQRIASQELVIRHPDYVEVSNSPEFVEWVQASPLRLMTAKQGVAGDVQAAIAVLDEFKSARKQKQDKGGATADLNTVSLERSSAAAPEPGQSRGRKYSRRAIRALMDRNPAKYQELQPQIRAAYERGDVIDDL